MMTPIPVIYRPADGLRYHLEDCFLQKREQFPADGYDYAQKFHIVEEFLNRNVHSEVISGASLQGNGLLNDHGKEHVSMVIQRAGLLLGDRVNDLSGYEIFLLLLAIHFHDVGNIFGREEHEEKIFEVMDKLGVMLPLDNATQIYIAKIAMAHGGKINGNKDTISSLLPKDHLQGVPIRPALIAALLRYADEISDDYTRAARFLLDSNLVPPKNEVFHLYSKCLQPPGIEESTLILKFELPPHYVINESSKEDKQESSGYSKIFLYDELLHRLKKCLCELEYCSRYSREFIKITSIRAIIEIHKPRALYPVYEDKIVFRLCGYPNTLDKNINEIVEKPPRAANGRKLKEMCEGDF